jgi:hypothetical protein
MMKLVAYSAAACFILAPLIPTLALGGFSPANHGFNLTNLLIGLALLIPVALVWIPATWVLERDVALCMRRTYGLLFLSCVIGVVIFGCFWWMLIEEAARFGGPLRLTTNQFWILLGISIFLLITSGWLGLRLWRIHHPASSATRSA